MDIRCLENAPVPTEALTRLYLDAGWTAYTDHPDIMAGLLPGALWHMSAWEGDELVGLIRCVGDGVSLLYVQDILVLASRQRRGIGRKLLAAALARFSHIRQIVLLTDNREKTRAFYEAAGFTEASRTGCLCYVRFSMEA
ncbi:MAG: GNAT family N-acetyltransferase [Eubacteriales bacterium]|nr:GNAT family N-acetyltransferase [Eubacteriales bacterium]